VEAKAQVDQVADDGRLNGRPPTKICWTETAVEVDARTTGVRVLSVPWRRCLREVVRERNPSAQRLGADRGGPQPGLWSSDVGLDAPIATRGSASFGSSQLKIRRASGTSHQ